MDWSKTKWCDNCGAVPLLENVSAHNATIHYYKCALCNQRFEFDTWTKAAKPVDPVRST
jgi:transcription elongation factor Elf1